jgi:presenilin-like A22 family membrane protease
VKTLAFVIAVCVLAVGIVGMLAPSSLVWLARHSETSGAFYVFGAVRVAFGLVLVSVAAASRAPRTLRALGSVIVIAGIATALTGLVAMERARVIIEWWLQQGSGIQRLADVVLLAAGGFVAYACAPARRAA